MIIRIDGENDYRVERWEDSQAIWGAIYRYLKVAYLLEDIQIVSGRKADTSKWATAPEDFMAWCKNAQPDDLHQLAINIPYEITYVRCTPYNISYMYVLK